MIFSEFFYEEIVEIKFLSIEKLNEIDRLAILAVFFALFFSQNRLVKL